MNSIWERKHFAWLGLLLVAVTVWAATSYADYLRALAERESSMDPTATHGSHFGLYQMGYPALADAGYYNVKSGAWTGKDGIKSVADFLANPDIQTKAISVYHAKADTWVKKSGLSDYIGTTIDGIPITASGLIAGYHLVGPAALRKFIEDGVAAKDALGTSVTEYLTKFAGYASPTTGVTYASVLAAHPTGGASVVGGGGGTPGGTPPSTLPPSLSEAGMISGPSAGGSLKPVSSSPLEGFKSGAGTPMDKVRNVLALLTAAAALLWLAYATLGSWRAFADGDLDLRDMTTTIVRGMVVVMIVVVLLW